MRKQYSTPVVEKITFDYKVIHTSSVECFGSIINVVPDGDTVCRSGEPFYVGWNNDHPAWEG